MHGQLVRREHISHAVAELLVREDETMSPEPEHLLLAAG